MEIYQGNKTISTHQHQWALRSKVKEFGNKVAIHYCTGCPATRIVSDFDMMDAATIVQKVKDLKYEVD